MPLAARPTTPRTPTGASQRKARCRRNIEGILTGSSMRRHHCDRAEVVHSVRRSAMARCARRREEKPVRLLIVEDEVRLASALQRGLGSEGFTVDAVSY